MKKKILSLFMVMLIVALSVVPAFAAEFTYTAVDGATGGNTEFDKYFVLDEDAEVPAVEFSYTVEGTAKKAATPGSKMEVIATTGKTMPKLYEKTTYADAAEAEAANKLGKLNFIQGEAKKTNTADPEWVTLKTGQAYAKRTMVVDFTGVTYDEPGIYRYKITEADSTTPALQGLSYDTQSSNKNRIRYLDVYVTDNGSGTLVVSNYVLHENDSEITPVTSDYGSLSKDEKEWYYDNGDADSTNDTYDDKANAETAATTVGETKAAAAYATEIEEVTDDQDPNYGKYMYNNVAYETEGEAQEACKAAYVAAEKAKINATKVELDDKSQGYVNELATYDIEFGKEVKGNQGSKDKYFKFTVKIEGLTENTVLQLDVTTKAHKTPTKNSATKYEAADMAAANSIDQQDDTATLTGQQLKAPASGVIEVPFYLQDGQYIAIKGLPVGAEYTISEDAEDYQKTEGTEITTKQVLDTIGDTLDNKHQDAVSGTIGSKEEYIKAADGMFWKDGTTYKPLYAGEGANADKVYTDEEKTLEHTGDRYKLNDQNVYTGYTNTRDGVIPTGVLVSVGGGIALVAVALGAILVLNRRRAEEE